MNFEDFYKPPEKKPAPATEGHLGEKVPMSVDELIAYFHKVRDSIDPKMQASIGAELVALTDARGLAMDEVATHRRISELYEVIQDAVPTPTEEILTS